MGRRSLEERSSAGTRCAVGECKAMNEDVFDFIQLLSSNGAYATLYLLNSNCTSIAIVLYSYED